MARDALSEPRRDEVSARLERFVRAMDDAIRIPGTSIRFGVDAILGLVPGVGDVASALASLAVLVVAAREGVPLLVLLRMGLNVGVDALVGSVPVLGTIFDVAFKANRRNLGLLDRHRAGGLRPRDVAPVFAAVAFVVALLLVPLAAAVALALWLLSLV